jgi:1-acyl-sn-glycerol-3-phosphate acyltransferase
MRSLIACLRAVRVGLHLLRGGLTAIIMPRLSQSRQEAVLCGWNRKLLLILNIKVDCSGPGIPPGRHAVLAANHVSWLDVIVINSLFPSCFVAKQEVSRWPFIGWLCKRCGTVFLSRGLRRDAHRANREIQHLLSGGVRIAIFPEGTSSEGYQVLPFHAALFQPAIEAGAQVVPLALRYFDPAGAINPALAYSGDLSFVASLWKVLCTPASVACCVASAPLPSAGKERRQLAQQAREHIASVLGHADSCLEAQRPDSHARPEYVVP